MKLVSFYGENNQIRLGIQVDACIYDLHAINPHIPHTMETFLKMGERGMELARITERAIREGHFQELARKEYHLAAPVPYPTSLRDAYAFRQHVVTSRANRGLKMIPEFDAFPVFYFSNHMAVKGPGEIFCMPDHFQQLDFELEFAVVLNKGGKNIKAEEADEHIAGFMIMNDFSARKLQMEEMKLNLGPAKGKDFVTTLGPWLVTPDELEQRKTFTREGHVGIVYHLNMICRVNQREVSRGNTSDMDWTFAELIERISYGVEMFPGEVIGSGTVGTGCFLELNGTGKREDPDYAAQWLKPMDTVELEIEGLGKLVNTVFQEGDGHTILNRTGK